MKKEYQDPIIKIEKIEIEDVLTGSLEDPNVPDEGWG